MESLIFSSNNIPFINCDANIDNVKLDEYNESILKGCDINKIKFIQIKIIINNNILFQTFYKNNLELWISKNNNIININLEKGITKKQEEFIIDIINKNKNISLTDEHHPHNENLINKPIYLYDQIKWKAAIKIQKAWREARYNNSYNICKKYEKHFVKSMLIDNNSFIDDYNKILTDCNDTILSLYELVNEFNESCDQISMENTF